MPFIRKIAPRERAEPWLKQIQHMLGMKSKHTTVILLLLYLHGEMTVGELAPILKRDRVWCTVYLSRLCKRGLVAERWFPWAEYKKLFRINEKNPLIGSVLETIWETYQKKLSTVAPFRPGLSQYRDVRVTTPEELEQLTAHRKEENGNE